MNFKKVQNVISISDSHFEGFGVVSTDPTSECYEYINSAIATPHNIDDAFHPIRMESTTVANTLDDAKIFIFRPNVR